MNSRENYIPLSKNYARIPVHKSFTSQKNVEKLADLAIEEYWGYNYIFLRKYLTQLLFLIFDTQNPINKFVTIIEKSDNVYATLNTGLLDTSIIEIFAIFRIRSTGWKFIEWATVKLAEYYSDGKLPEKPMFQHDCVIFNPKLPIQTLYDPKTPKNLKRISKTIEHYLKLKGPITPQDAEKRLYAAWQRAIKLCENEAAYATHYITFGQVSFLIPLNFLPNEKFEDNTAHLVAVIVRKETPQGMCLVWKEVVKLNTAYLRSRIMGKFNRLNWLHPTEEYPLSNINSSIINTNNINNNTYINSMGASMPQQLLCLTSIK